MRSRRLTDLGRRWWAGQLGGAGALLDAAFLPAELLYRAVSDARNAAYDRGLLRIARAAVPVISVGNLAVGGAGKTPFSAWLVAWLRERGRRPALLHGGYAADEPALHRAWAPGLPVIAERDRVLAAGQAAAAGADVLVLDDAFQHRRLARDLDIVLLAAEQWVRRPRLLPRGGWREAPGALGRADVIVVTRRIADAARAAAVADEAGVFAPGAPVVQVRLAAEEWEDGCGRPITAPGEAVAVTAIAEPDAFLANARSAGAVLTGAQVWPDHYEYGRADAALLLREAGTRPIVTTAKDWIKLRALLPAEQVRILRQRVLVEAGEQLLLERVESALSR